MFYPGDKVINRRGRYGVTVLGSTGTVCADEFEMMEISLSRHPNYRQQAPHMRIIWDEDGPKGKGIRVYNSHYFPIDVFDLLEPAEPPLVQDTRSYLEAVAGGMNEAG